jgi:hypothetical protein
LAYSLKKSEKIITKEKAGEKDFGLMTGRKKRVHFLGKGHCENVRERSSGEKEEQKGLMTKLKCQ